MPQHQPVEVVVTSHNADRVIGFNCKTSLPKRGRKDRLTSPPSSFLTIEHTPILEGSFDFTDPDSMFKYCYIRNPEYAGAKEQKNSTARLSERCVMNNARSSSRSSSCSREWIPIRAAIVDWNPNAQEYTVPLSVARKHVAYCIEVDYGFTKRQVFHRYSSFRELHKRLVSQFGVNAITPLTGKRFSQFSEAVILHRVRRLNEFLAELIRSDVFRRSKPLTHFLGVNVGIMSPVSSFSSLSSMDSGRESVVR